MNLTPRTPARTPAPVARCLPSFDRPPVVTRARCLVRRGARRVVATVRPLLVTPAGGMTTAGALAFLLVTVGPLTLLTIVLSPR